MNDQRQIQNLEVEVVYEVLGSSSRGLTSDEAGGRLLEAGKNTVEVADRWRILRCLLKQFTNFFTLLLIVSSIICFVAEVLQPGENMNVLGWALGAVALLNALFSFVQEYRAEKAMEALRKFLPPAVDVIRDGLVMTILAEDLVPGDLLLLQEGVRVPADARLVVAEGLMVNNAPLTGEAQPVTLTTAPQATSLVESRNVVFAGCLVLRGTGQALVFATGLRTEFGKLARLSQTLHRAPSPLERQTAHMVRVLTVIAVALGGSFFLYGVFSGRSLWVNLVFMLGIIVANVPEGLLPTFTLALSMGSLRMARKNVLVTSLNAVEAMGAVQVICTDKTGTLTHNQLSVSRLTSSEQIADLENLSWRKQMLQLALGASDVRLKGSQFVGDPLDVAIVECLEREGCSGAEQIENTFRHFPFDVEKKRAAGCASWNGCDYFSVKGAWEVLRPLLSGLQTESGSIQPADQGSLDAAETIMTSLAASGYRVVGVAYRTLATDESNCAEQDLLEKNLILAGFLGIEDPLRKEVPAAIACCQRAGIEVILITGDHPDTAKSVAEQCGILESEASADQVMTGDVLENLSERELEAALEKGVRIFARTSPAQKMKIVLALKNLNRVVAMTGDGVNDAPALKAADVGVAMGKSGTDVARAAAQVILLDDNFASIVAGIEEGRTVFMNIRKFTNYVLVSNGPEILPFLLYILLPIPLALTVIQILCIDLGTDIIPSMALGQEPPEADAMRQPPRGQDFQLLSPGLVVHSYLFLGLIEAIWALSLFFFVLHDGGWHYGMDLAASDPLYRSATGITLATILLMQVGNLLGRRYARRSGLDRGVLRNRLMFAGILIQFLFSWALLYWAPLQKILGTGPVAWPIYLVAWLGIPLIFLSDFLRKIIFVKELKPIVNP